VSFNISVRTVSSSSENWSVKSVIFKREIESKCLK
jgi:hypothetical protein